MGSPNLYGNTAKLVNEILMGASDSGAEKKLYNLAALNIKGCDACYRCQEEGKCVIDDDMQYLYKELQSSDALVLGSPVYMWQMSAQTKLFVDRLMAFMNGDSSSRLKGKKLILAFTQANADPAVLRPYLEHTAGLLYYLGFDVLETIVAAGTEECGICFQTETLVKARDLGRSLVGRNVEVQAVKSVCVAP